MRKLLPVIFILGAILYISMSGIIKNIQNNAVAVPSFSIATLENSAYRLDKKAVKLHNGEYIETSRTKDNSQPPYDFMVDFSMSASGDLNNDGISDAVVVLAMNGGGSGSFSYLAAVLNQDGEPLNVDTVLIGISVDIKSIKIASGMIILDLLIHGFWDPMCCPEKKAHYEYKLVQSDKKYKLLR